MDIDELNSKIKVVESQIKVLKQQKQEFLDKLHKYKKDDKRIAIMSKVRTIDIALSYCYKTHKSITRQIHALGAFK